MSFRPPGRQGGLSIIELIIFIVVMGIAAAGIMQVFNLSTKASADPVRRKQALLLAEAMLEEIELARFTYCDPTDANAATATSAVNGGGTDPLLCAGIAEGFGTAGGANTRPFDNVSDYVTAAGVVSPYTVGVLPLVASVTMNVVAPGAPLGTAALQVASDATAARLNVVRITVSVNYGGANDNVTLDGYRTRYAPTSYP
ncbi:type II secretion system protein [Rugamonas sp. DEMB1]|uniref:type II secretion system protein n=1 Tax=Rugamonas sp. DEMB1 TaxID=3039386 RepID=UPI002448770E|nr:type II secretion system protein [Rugamonas sp. DEMB1]WGG52679.1 type II secretion system protein [Rugamonas sp. DEMB1]